MPTNAPVVALVAPNGLVGRAFVPIFVEATTQGDIAQLKLVASKETDTLRMAIQAAPRNTVKLSIVNYMDKSALEATFEGTDVVVSTMGGTGDQRPAASEQTVIEAAAKAGVKIYFPSDFGCDYSDETWGVPMWESKKAYAALARGLGLKTISVSSGLFMHLFLTSMLGFNLPEWEIPEDGNTPFALSDVSDVGRYTLRAIILARQDPKSVPDRLRVYSDAKTLNEYASIVERVTQTKLTKRYIPRTKLLAIWENDSGQTQYPNLFLKIMVGTTAIDFSEREHNELLNPGGTYFKPASFEKLVESTLKL
ncbi:NAD(P)-binding protein [Clavulina sp. PMI_390]|nr:NAD(P)-binding protein [Clavulina sp. PMI_390]